MTGTQTKTKKQKLIQLIHIGRGKIGLQDEDYRSLLLSVTKKASCKDMTTKELEEVLKALKGLGFSVKKMPLKDRDIGRATPDQLAYIKGLWELAARVKTEEALARFVKRITGVQFLRWMNIKQAQKVILAVREMAGAAGFDPDGMPLPE